jgi:hypothetical protein
MVDPEVVELARTAGTTVVTLMATDTWTRTRDGLVSLWRRIHPERADAIAAELDSSRSDLLTAQTTGDQQSENELRAEWQGRMRRLLAADPAAVVALRQLLDELSAEQAQAEAQHVPIQMNAVASGHSRVYQAGRDQHITER